MKGHEGQAATFAALKVVAYGGPVALFFSAAGATALGVAFWDRPGEHFDVMVILGVTGIVLGFVEWALARRFAAHEKTEAAQYERVASIADGAAQQIGEFTRATREHTAELHSFRSEVRAVRSAVSDLERRVGQIEERWMRPALGVPSRPHGSEES